MNATPAQSPARSVVVGLGEVLFDLLPAGKQLGGAPANFAYHAKALGADAQVVTRVGGDQLGQEILQRLQSSGLSTELISVDSNFPTGTVSIELNPDGQPCFTIHENVAWDQLEATNEALQLMSHCDAVCFGSLSQRTPGARKAIHSLVAAVRPGALRIFDINLRQHFFSPEVIEKSLQVANVLKINDQELPVLAGMFGFRGDSLAQITQIADRFKLNSVALTRGANGSVLLSRGRLSEHPGSPVRVVDSVGAGDAFTAAMTLGLLREWELDRINRCANSVAAYVCSQAGATPALPAEFRGWFCAETGSPEQGCQLRLG